MRVLSHLSILCVSCLPTDCFLCQMGIDRTCVYLHTPITGVLPYDRSILCHRVY